MGNLLDGYLDEESELYTVDELRQMINLLAGKIAERTGGPLLTFDGLVAADGVVRNLAASDAPLDAYYDECQLCGQYVTHGGRYSSLSRYAQAQRHESACPWRRAVELVSGGRDPDDAEGPEGPLVERGGG